MNEIRIRWKNQVPPTLPGGGFQFYDHDLGWTAMTVVEADHEESADVPEGFGLMFRALDDLKPGEVYFQSYADGLFCAPHRGSGANALSADSLQLAQRMLRAPVSTFAAETWPRRRGTDLRRFALQSLERHLERKLRTAEALGRLGG